VSGSAGAEWKEAASDRLAEGWVVKGLNLDQRPPNRQQFVHKYTQGLHFGERIVFPTLQIGIELRKAVIILDHAQAGAVEQSAWWVSSG
jgi:hypothetical protein